MLSGFKDALYLCHEANFVCLRANPNKHFFKSIFQSTQVETGTD